MEKLEKLRNNLQSSYVAKNIVCREREYDEISSFIMSRIEQEVGGCLFVSGMPGCGKTLTVKSAVHNLEEQLKKYRHKGKVLFIYVNGLKLTDPHQCFSQIYFEISGRRVPASKAETILGKYFNEPSGIEPLITLIVDELDSLYTKKQDIIYRLFDWPTKPSSRLIVIAIANTFHLPEKFIGKRALSRAGIDRVDFRPYTHQQLHRIVMERLEGAEFVKSDGVMLVARKVASISSDARQVFRICKRTIEIAQSDYQTKKKKGKPEVPMEYFKRALDEIQSEPYVVMISNASEFQKIFFRATIYRFEITGVQEASCGDIYQEFLLNLSEEYQKIMNFSEFLQIAYKLDEMRLIALERDGTVHEKLVRLKFPVEQVGFALQLKN